ncbi:ankyrin repeat-containing domain protein [Dactylonectria macrodidyma]|uniref:Ankyrin repeat-containing domain protein n=1 Tax=Dactylonectria macrodidyma TaxID=307937 RepID=A0A9P9E1F8_9HYPO|nr:ankyrin repeat-containing domain protein [Dactylonectria macrodidyma]
MAGCGIFLVAWRKPAGLELLSSLADCLRSERGLNALVQTNRRLNCALNPYLYHYNAQSSRKSALEWAVTGGEEETAQKAIDAWWMQALLHAIKNCYDTAVKLLLHYGIVDANIEDNSNRTPLSKAAGSEHEAIIHLLLDSGKIDTDSKDHYDRTQLSGAARNGHSMSVMLLLNSDKVDANSRDADNATPVSWVAYEGRKAVMQVMLEPREVDAVLKDSYGRTPPS